MKQSKALGFLRNNVLGPLVLLAQGARPQGVRRLENHAGSYLDGLKLTIPEYNQVSCLNCLRKTIELYQNLREDLLEDQDVSSNKNIISEVTKYLNEIENKIIARMLTTGVD